MDRIEIFLVKFIHCVVWVLCLLGVFSESKDFFYLLATLFLLVNSQLIHYQILFGSLRQKDNS